MNQKLIVLLVIAFVIFVAMATVPKFTTSEDHPVINEIRRRIATISPKFANVPIRTGNRSFTENKSVITLCVVNPDTQQYYDINVLMYVTCHELAHVITKARGSLSHADEFKENFAKLLRDAAIKGVYDPNTGIPVAYCGSREE